MFAGGDIVGTHGEVIVGDQSVPFRLGDAFDPMANAQPFLLEDESIKYESKPWKRVPMGKLDLDAGMFTVQVKLNGIRGSSGIEFKELEIR